MSVYKMKVDSRLTVKKIVGGGALLVGKYAEIHIGQIKLKSSEFCGSP
jgi:hypothetical protein